MFVFSMAGASFWKMVEKILEGWGLIVEGMSAVAKFVGLEKIGKGLDTISGALKAGATNAKEAGDAAIVMADKNYKAMASFDSIDKTVSKMKPGKRFSPIDEDAEKKAKEAREAWSQTLRDMTADIDKVDLDPFEQKLVDIAKKAEVLREKAAKLPTAAEREKAGKQIDHWTNSMIESESSSQARKDFQDWLKDQENAEKYRKDQANLRKAARESAISGQIAELDIAEKLGTAHRETIGERIRLQKELLVIQEDYLGQLDKEKDPASWYAQKNAIDNVRKSLADLTREQLIQNPFAAMKLGYHEMINDWSNTGKQMYDLAKETAQAMQSAFSDFFFDLMEGNLKSLSDYINAFLKSVARSLSDIMSQQVSASILSSFGFAQGGVFDGGRVIPFASGGLILRSPIVFPMASGAIGLAGEAGPEAIMPLKRLANGNLGVQSDSAAQAVTNNLNVEIKLENKSSQQLNVSQGPTKYEFNKMIITAVIEDYQRNGMTRSILGKK
jgi:phage-related minor tail protein